MRCVRSKSLHRKFDSARKFWTKISRSCEKFGGSCILPLWDLAVAFVEMQANSKMEKNEGNPDCWLVLEAKNAFFLLWHAMPYFRLVRKWRRHTNKDDEITSPTLRQTCSFKLFLKATIRNLDDQRIFLSERIFFPRSDEDFDHLPTPSQQKKVVLIAFQL